MPCSDPDHVHVWPASGELTLEPCENICGYCNPPKTLATLRSHVTNLHFKEGRTHAGMTLTPKGRPRRSDATSEVTTPHTIPQKRHNTETHDTPSVKKTILGIAQPNEYRTPGPSPDQENEGSPRTIGKSIDLQSHTENNGAKVEVEEPQAAMVDAVNQVPYVTDPPTQNASSRKAAMIDASSRVPHMTNRPIQNKSPRKATFTPINAPPFALPNEPQAAAAVAEEREKPNVDGVAQEKKVDIVMSETAPQGPQILFNGVDPGYRDLLQRLGYIDAAVRSQVKGMYSMAIHAGMTPAFLRHVMNHELDVQEGANGMFEQGTGPDGAKGADMQR